MGKERFFGGGFIPNGLNGIFLNRNVLDVCEKLTIFPYGQYINGIVIKSGFKNVLCYKIEVGYKCANM